MKHLAMLDSYYDILAPQVSTHLSNDDHAALFTLYKVIYPNYGSRHYVQEISDLIVATFLSRWALHLRASQVLLSTNQGKFVLSNMQATILDILNQSYPRWQSHQIFPYCRTVDSTEMPHGNSDNTAFVLHMKCELLAPNVNLEDLTENLSH